MILYLPTKPESISLENLEEKKIAVLFFFFIIIIILRTFL